MVNDDGSTGNTLVLQSLSRVGCRAFLRYMSQNAAEAAFPAERTPWERRYSLEFRGPFRKLPQNPTESSKTSIIHLSP